jgi:hypothetical protein
MVGILQKELVGSAWPRSHFSMRIADQMRSCSSAGLISKLMRLCLHLFHAPHQPLPSRSPRPFVILKHSRSTPNSLSATPCRVAPSLSSTCCIASASASASALALFPLVSSHNGIPRYRRQALDTDRRLRSSFIPIPHSLSTNDRSNNCRIPLQLFLINTSPLL